MSCWTTTAFWRLQANSLAVLMTPDDMRTFRLANKLHESVEVSDRFHLKPLLRAVAFPHTAFVLAISENAVRLIEMSAGSEPQEISVPELPEDAASAVHKSTLNSRGPIRAYPRFGRPESTPRAIRKDCRCGHSADPGWPGCAAHSGRVSTVGVDLPLREFLSGSYPGRRYPNRRQDQQQRPRCCRDAGPGSPVRRGFEGSQERL